MTYESRTPECAAALHTYERGPKSGNAHIYRGPSNIRRRNEVPSWIGHVAGDDEWRRRVEALLRAHERLGNFMETPPLEEPPDSTTNNGDSNTK